jgi:uncharacterized cupin superfamily protein
LIKEQTQHLAQGSAVGTCGEREFFNEGVEAATLLSIRTLGSVYRESSAPTRVVDARSLKRGSFSYPGDTETFGDGARLTKALELKALGINFEILSPGQRSSWPHAESLKEEFCFVLRGHPTIWINGYTHVAKPGDLVFFEPGSNLAHTVMNDSSDTVEYLGFGPTSEACAGNRIYYPFHAARNEQCRARGDLWEDRPSIQMGPHPGIPAARLSAS